MAGGKTGYASTEAFDDGAVRMLIRGVLESAALAEAEEQDEIFAGDPEYPEVTVPENDLDSVTAEEKLRFALEMGRHTGWNAYWRSPAARRGTAPRESVPRSQRPLLQQPPELCQLLP